MARIEGSLPTLDAGRGRGTGASRAAQPRPSSFFLPPSFLWHEVSESEGCVTTCLVPGSAPGKWTQAEVRRACSRVRRACGGTSREGAAWRNSAELSPGNLPKTCQHRWIS